MTGFPVCCRVSSWDPDFSLFAHQGCFGWDFFSFWISQWLVGHQLFTLLDVACPGCPKTASKRLALKAYALGWYENNDKKMDARYMCSTASNFPKNSLACHVPVPVMPGKGPRNACVKKRMTRIESRRILFGEMWEVGSWIYWSDVVELLTLTFAGKSGAMYTLYGKFEAWRFGCWVTESWCRCNIAILEKVSSHFLIIWNGPGIFWIISRNSNLRNSSLYFRTTNWHNIPGCPKNRPPPLLQLFTFTEVKSSSVRMLWCLSRPMRAPKWELCLLRITQLAEGFLRVRYMCVEAQNRCILPGQVRESASWYYSVTSPVCKYGKLREISIPYIL